MKCDWNQWRVMQLPAPALPLFQSSHIRGSQRKKRKAYEKVMFLKHRIFYLKVYQQIIWSLEVWFASFCIFLYLLYLSLDHAFVFLLLLFFSWPLFCIRKWKSWGYNNSGSWANSMASLAMLLLLYEQQCGPVDCSPPGSSVHGFSRQEYWSGLPFPSLGDLPNPGIEPRSPALQADALTSEPPGKPSVFIIPVKYPCSLILSSVPFFIFMGWLSPGYGMYFHLPFSWLIILIGCQTLWILGCWVLTFFLFVSLFVLTLCWDAVKLLGHSLIIYGLPLSFLRWIQKSFQSRANLATLVEHCPSAALSRRPVGQQGFLSWLVEVSGLSRPVWAPDVVPLSPEWWCLL